MVSYYQTEGINSFLVIQVNMEAVDSYETDMLYNNFVEGIIQPEFRALDGEMYIYNKINGLVSVKEYMRSSVMAFNQTKNLVEKICDVALEAREYMLRPENILINTDYIFCTADGHEYRFVYMPDEAADVRKQIKRLIEDVMKHIDHRNTSLTDFMYSVYEITAKPHFDIIELKEYVKNQRDDASPRDEEEQEYNHNEELLDVVFENDVCGAPGTTALEKDRRRYIKIMNFVIAATLVLSLAIVILQLMKDGIKLNVRPVMCMLVVVSVEMFVYMELKRLDDKKEGIDIMTADTGEISCNLTPQNEPVERATAKDDSTTVLKDPEETTVLSAGIQGREQDEAKLEVEFVGEGFNCKIAVGKEKKLIGRESKSVDICFDDRGVSRRHAVIYTENTVLYIEDSGSTNGTFVNGIRLMEGRKLALETGDKVTIGENEYKVAIYLFH